VRIHTIEQIRDHWLRNRGQDGSNWQEALGAVYDLGAQSTVLAEKHGDKIKTMADAFARPVEVTDKDGTVQHGHPLQELPLSPEVVTVSLRRVDHGQSDCDKNSACVLGNGHQGECDTCPF
jgi:hypothetical protein